jgi:hypothetical protein
MITKSVYAIEVKGFSGAWVEMKDYVCFHRDVAEERALSLALSLNRDVRIRERKHLIVPARGGKVVKISGMIHEDNIIETIEV